MIQHASAMLERLPHFRAQPRDLLLGLFRRLGINQERPQQFTNIRLLNLVRGRRQ